MSDITIEEIIEAASEVFEEDDIDLWLSSPNAFLDDYTPHELFTMGEGARVMSLIDALATGSYM